MQFFHVTQYVALHAPENDFMELTPAKKMFQRYWRKVVQK